MEGLLVLLGLAVLIGGGIVIAVFAGVFKVEGDQKKAESTAGDLLDATFDGSPVVTFKTHMRTLKYETVVAGAIARGYRLSNQALNQHGYGSLIFEKATTAASS